ncbi:MAG: DNA polymerase III subunit delta [Dehalococcoidia bacterium]|nr:DNA polymerase III subunit delta [Dehalococcoidia bacterium]
MLYIFGGQDSFSRRAAIETLKHNMGGGDMASLNIMVFEGARLPADQLSAVCNSAPFFADRRLIIIDGLLTRFESRERKGADISATPKTTKGGNPWQAYVDCLKNLPSTVDVVLQDDSATRTNRVLRELEKGAEVRWFVPLRPGDLPAWIERRIKDGGGSISPGAIRVLVEAVGNNLWVLAAEIEKLVVYRGRVKISDEDVKQMVSYARDANVFAMVDALIERRADMALQYLHQLLDQGATLPYLVVMITRQFRLLIQAKELVMQRACPAEIRRILAISSDFVFDKAMKQLAGYTPGKLEEIYHLLLRIDLEAKTGKVDQGVALDLLVMDLCRRSPQVATSVKRFA